MKRGKVLACYNETGKPYIKELSGYRLLWHGHPFAVYKLGNRWCILEATTGMAILNCNRLKDVYDTMVDKSNIVKSAIELVNNKELDMVKEAQKLIKEYAIKNIKEDF